MIVDMTKPLEEPEEKKPKLGAVIEEVMNIRNDNIEDNAQVKIRLTEVATNVAERLANFKQNVNDEIDLHKSKPGPAHNEDKNTIGLGVKENLPAAKLSDLKNNIYRREWCTPQLLSYIIGESLKANKDDYLTDGLFPLSSGRLLGKTLTNQIFHTDSTQVSDISPMGQVNYLFSTEESYVMFAEYGKGRVTNFSEGGEKAPIGIMNVDVRNGHVYATRGQPVSLNNLTTSGKFVKKVTGLAWGLGDINGNFYDSNFHPTVAAMASSDSVTQEVEASLFDPTMIIKPDGVSYARNLNTTKHNFNELTLYKDGNYPFNNATFLSSDNFMSHTANTQLIKQSNRWGIQFDFLSGEVGVADWLPESITKSTDKVLSRQTTYILKNTHSGGITGFNSANSFNTLGSVLPWGYENRNDFDNSNFSSAAVYTTLFLPINDLINGFDKLSSAQQQTFINSVNKDLLVRITSAWDNEYIKSGILRIPFYYEVPNVDKAWCLYIDIKFSFQITNGSNIVKFSAYHWDSSTKPTINAQLDLTNTDDTRFTLWKKTVEETPLHPKVFKGCFLETGGHITAYTIGHRQYICHYEHEITSTREWMINDIVPTIEVDEKITAISMFPGNRFYSDNTRILPLSETETSLVYLTRYRDKYNKYRYGTFTGNKEDFDLLSGRNAESSQIRRLERNVSGNIPILVDNSNLRSPGINTTGMVFSEANGFIGYRDHGFNGSGFIPNGPTEIEEALKNRILTGCGIINPYPIFFYFNEMLYWSVVSRDGQLNGAGKDGCVGGVRVDLLYDGKSFIIRTLPDMKPKYVWGNVFDDYPTGQIRGRDSESFDDVFIVNKTGVDKTTYVFMNYPDFEGRYYRFELIQDSNGYYFPNAFTPNRLNLKKECGYGTEIPYVFYGSYFAPFMMENKFYLPQTSIYTLSCYTADSTTNYRDYYMGWKNEQPIYLLGENITLNGKSLLLDQTITLPIKGHNHRGRIFLSYFNETFDVYSSSENPLGSPTEPVLSVVFVGYWEKIGSDYVLSFHAPRGVNNNVSLDFVNSLLPVVDGKQMSIDSMGSTFPAILGKLSGPPRQYYFKK